MAQTMCRLLGYRYGRKYYSPSLNRMPSNATSYPPFVIANYCYETEGDSGDGARRALLRRGGAGRSIAGGSDRQLGVSAGSASGADEQGPVNSAQQRRRLLSQPRRYSMDIPARAKTECMLWGPMPNMNPVYDVNACNPDTGPFAAVECTGACSSRGGGAGAVSGVCAATRRHHKLQRWHGW